MIADLPQVKYNRNADSTSKRGKYDVNDPDYQKVVDLNKQILEKLRLKNREPEPIDEKDYETHSLSE